MDFENIIFGKAKVYDFLYESEINRYPGCCIIISNPKSRKYNIQDHGGAKTGIVMSLGERTYKL